jgi:hypothetical protein
MVVDLSELLDLHEDGFAVQTSERLEVNRAVTLCLDLPETKSFIHGSGQVIWSDDAGRGGIRLSALPEASRKILREWLFTNLLIAGSNYSARTEQRARRNKEEEAEQDEQESPEPQPVAAPVPAPDLAQKDESRTAVPISDASGKISRVETEFAPSEPRRAASLQLEALRKEVGEIGDDVDAVLQLISARALLLTGASGAALAFLTDDKMICRARAGEPAPPLGAPLDIKQGLSGECVRSGLLVSCEDMENDPRVDPEVGRALGIGSLMAAPIVSDFRVVGLLEIFSPQPRAFANADWTLFGRLVEMIPNIHRDQAHRDQYREKTRFGYTRAEATIKPEAASGAPPSPAESGPIKSGSKEFDSMHAIREALWEQRPMVEHPGQVPQVPENITLAEVSEQVPGQNSEAAPASPSRLLYRALLGLVVAVATTVLGYLLGPTIQRHWDEAMLASRNGVVETVSAQSATGRNLDAMSTDDLRRLALQGDADAEWRIALRYRDGDGVPKDGAQAMQWSQRAAEHGNVAAQSALGAYYWAGRGVPEDLSKAYFWSAIAAAQGDAFSESRLEGLAPQMTRAQVAAASQQAEAWMHQHSVAQPARK